MDCRRFILAGILPTVAGCAGQRNTTASEIDEQPEPTETATGFTPAIPATPIPEDRFTDAYKEYFDPGEIGTASVRVADRDAGVVSLTYGVLVADHEALRRAHADAYLAVVRETGGTGWDMSYEARITDTDLEYTWEIREQWALDRLSGRLTAGEFAARIEASITRLTSRP